VVCVKLVPEACESVVRFLGPTTGALFGTYLTSLEALFRPPSICPTRRKLGLLLCGRTDDGGVGVISLLGGIILHDLLPFFRWRLGVNLLVMCLRS
jgi:hypothetical protein